MNAKQNNSKSIAIKLNFLILSLLFVTSTKAQVDSNQAAICNAVMYYQIGEAKTIDIKNYLQDISRKFSPICMEMGKKQCNDMYQNSKTVVNSLSQSDFIEYTKTCIALSEQLK